MPGERPTAGGGPERERGVPAPSLDRPVFGLAVVAVIGVCLPLGLLPEQAGPFVTAVYDWTTSNLGLFYQWFAIGVIVFLVWLAFGRHGDVRLGDADDAPEFSTFSWAGMLFCAGVGAGLLYWAGIEWCPTRSSWRRAVVRLQPDSAGHWDFKGVIVLFLPICRRGC